MEQYSELFDNFWKKNQKITIGASSTAMYLYLLYKSNLKSNTTFYLSDGEISQALCLHRNTLSSTRKKLSEFGLINYESKNGCSTLYTIIKNGFDKIENNSKLQLSEKKEKQKKEEKNNQHTSIKSMSQIPEEKKLEKKEKRDFNENIPSWKSFLDYAKGLEDFEIELESKIKEKYDTWVQNDWKNNLGRPITNWENLLKKTLPFFKNSNPISLDAIPTIKPPITN